MPMEEAARWHLCGLVRILDVMWGFVVCFAVFVAELTTWLRRLFVGSSVRWLYRVR